MKLLSLFLLVVQVLGFEYYDDSRYDIFNSEVRNQGIHAPLGSSLCEFFSVLVRCCPRISKVTSSWCGPSLGVLLGSTCLGAWIPADIELMIKYIFFNFRFKRRGKDFSSSTSGFLQILVKIAELKGSPKGRICVILPC